MSTIPGLSASNIYSYLSATNAGGTLNQANYAAMIQAAELSAITTLTSSGNNASSPLTYSATGLPGSFQQTATGASNAATTSAQAAQNAYLQIEYTLAQALGSLMSSSSTNSANSDLSSLFGLAGTADLSNLFGPTTGSLLPTGSSSAQVAQYAAINAQYALTQAIGSFSSTA